MASTKFTTVASDILCEFLEVAFHALLYTRGLYPAGVFERRQKYNVPVQMVCHPGVNEYLSDLLKSLKGHIEAGSVEQVVFCILGSEDEKPLERFVFQIAAGVGDKSMESDAYLSRLEQSLRTFTMKLNISDSLLKDLPEDCTWSVQIYTKESTMLESQSNQSLEDFQWVVADDREVAVEEASLLPVKNLDSGILQMQCYVEESQSK